jgi:hypothetical protein
MRITVIGCVALLAGCSALRFENMDEYRSIAPTKVHIEGRDYVVKRNYRDPTRILVTDTGLAASGKAVAGIFQGGQETSLAYMKAAEAYMREQSQDCVMMKTEPMEGIGFEFTMTCEPL